MGDTAYEVVGETDIGDPITVPPALPREIEDEEEEVFGLEPSPVKPQSDRRTYTFCPGFAIVISALVITLTKVRRHR